MYHVERSSVLMSFRNFFKKRIRKHNQSFEDLNVIIESNLDLAEGQKEVITSIVKKGYKEREELHDIAISITMFFSFSALVSLNEIDDGVEVSIKFM